MMHYGTLRLWAAVLAVVGGLGVIMAAIGTVAAIQLPIDAVPDMTNVQVQVLTDAGALSPVEVERYVTYPVEAMMSGLPQVAELRSVSKFGISVVTIVFEEGTDIYWARQLVAERLGRAAAAIIADGGRRAPSGRRGGGSTRSPQSPSARVSPPARLRTSSWWK